jgi:uncharacterized membrane protein
MDSTPSFPLAAPEFSGDSRVVPSARAFDWLRYGWALFAAEPGIWVAIAVIYFVLFFAVTMVPFVGAMAINLLMPVLAGGALIGCRKLDEGGNLRVADLFAGFSANPVAPVAAPARELVTVGVLNMLAWLAILAIGFVIGGGAVAGGVAMNRPAGIGFALGGVLLAVLIEMVLLLPLIMAVWFAPALVVFHGMKAMPALKASFVACARNWLVFTVYGIVVTLLTFFALLPVGLGMLVLLPVLFGSLYASYRDIFVGV